MVSLFVREGGRSERIDRAALKRLSAGATGTVYAVTGGHYMGMAFKEYEVGKAPPLEKLQAMLSNPPQHGVVANTQIPQFAWPRALVIAKSGRYVGFLMPLISHTESTSLVPYITASEGLRQLSPHERSLPSRYVLCRNLAVALRDLHGAGHAMVDLKDQNLRVYRRTLFLTVIDTDGCRICNRIGGQVYPAEQYSPGYIAPEALKGSAPPSALGQSQDLFALAVLIFQVLTFGVHPYQGVAASMGKSNDEGVLTGIYAYSGQSPMNQYKVAGCKLDCLDDNTLKLFERAFLGHPDQRPTAAQWADNFNGVLR